jgi:hypothetical protein
MAMTPAEVALVAVAYVLALSLQERNRLQGETPASNHVS